VPVNNLFKINDLVSRASLKNNNFVEAATFLLVFVKKVHRNNEYLDKIVRQDEEKLTER